MRWKEQVGGGEEEKEEGGVKGYRVLPVKVNEHHAID